ncbi:MAG: ATP-binding cassette domain-containing protein [Nocardioides sp.]|nr:ATP-binding cassette domain-containing protein [Nocardioides sp.]
MSADVLVEGRGLCRRFGTGDTAFVALHHSDLRIMAGDRIAVTGSSGSGKSTLLHLAAGLDHPTDGTISWPGLGRPCDHPGRVGVVFQAPSLLPALDVLENVELVALLAGATPADARRRANGALAALELQMLASQLPEELSGGQAQRVAIARVLAGAPTLILADEPTGQLDHDTAGHVLDVLEAAADASGAALVVATHDPIVADRFATRWTVSDGRLRTDRPAVADPAPSTAATRREPLSPSQTGRPR